MHITLYRKYRPKNFEEMAGQKEIIKTLKSSLRNDKLSQAYLFTGPRGVGKTTTARLIAKGVNCLEKGITDEPCEKCQNCLAINNGTFMDMVEIDAASNRGIDEIRQLKEKINYQPVEGRKKIYIIDEVHMLTKEAFNALLKTLEEPPEHVIFILATTEADKILPTIISRCQRYDFKSLTLNELENQLRYICEKEDVKVEEGVLEIIYENSGGSVRDAISILERLIITNLDEDLTLEKTENILGITSTKQMEDFLELLNNREYNKLIQVLDDYWYNSVEVEGFFKDFAKFCKIKITKNQLEIDKGIGIINKIYTSISKFKYEEDKRLVGYVIVDEILNDRAGKEKIVERIVEISSGVKEQERTDIGVSIEDIGRRWAEIVKNAKEEKIVLGALLINAKPYRMEDNILYISFDIESNLHKEMMENSMYNEAFTKVLKDMINPNIVVKYVVLGNKKVETKKDDLKEKVLSYFGGEII